MITTIVADKIAELAATIEKRIPDVSLEVTAFPSGGAMLDVRREGRLFVLSYSPKLNFGVDEVKDGEGFQLGYKYGFEEFEPAAAKLWSLVAGAKAT